MSAGEKAAAEIRAGLDHPVIDSDGHWIEYAPHIVGEMRRIGGDIAAEGFLSFGKGIVATVARGLERRREDRVGQEAWWAVPTRNTRDRATAMMPNLLRDRLDEFGIDFVVLYPTLGLGLPGIDDDAARRAACHAYNVYTAEFFSAHVDRLTPAAVIPMHEPWEAIAELDHARALGLKTVMMGSMIKRPIPSLQARAPDLASAYPWLDVLGLDSPHDYDPVWQRCRELGISPVFHSNGRGAGFGLRNTVSNFVYNHIGHFAAASEAVCKALIMGGVTGRFPDLKFGFLEGGVGWACQLYCDLLGHYDKRNVDALAETDPANLDQGALLALARRHADPGFLDVMEARAGRAASPRSTGAPAEGLDDFAACDFRDETDLARQFTENFYFGCEADDPINAWAFKPEYLPHEATLNTLFGSDIGHFDVADMAGILPEAHELVDDGLIDRDDFRRFTFENAVRFLSENRRDFFAGTVVERQVADYWRQRD